MVSFELGRDIRKDFYRLVTSVGQRKNSEESNLRLSDSTLRCSTTEPQRLWELRVFFARDKTISIFLYFFFSVC